ncbi:DNA cytosine methyltransferase [Burkholderia cepacia]|uniref:DNA (cytosine-5-)-methyltransferase n=1 Tax=Burkholderia cepacia TaxID=292 RepID=A0AAX2RJ76_BURCE|nr:DNA cytosine methyltransferase [Burkholderia cepacia]TET05348.1 DNA cytosine methyltransferase [Burkholderia cepacia]TEU40321.1 DNA cytosine methyltransferase [Burkholderia cepacia]TEU42418.1 DNA cytosine methyltransferase [Burkholderia cepacia]TEU57457.1 DNA cytosine methyltransferase [Burkholderia cepacia]
MNELALFAGAGGGILGGKLLGWRTVCAVERDAYAAQVLACRQNDGAIRPFPIWSDVETFDGRPWRGIVDVVSGGFPCQDISIAGMGIGIDGRRSGLWSEMARIVRDVRPSIVLVENSPMLTSRGLGRVLGDLASLGFDAEWGVISAADTGAPHKRERIWIVANARGRRYRLSIEAIRPRWDSTQPGSEALADPYCDDSDRRRRVVQMGRLTSSGEVASDGFGRGTEWPAEPGMGRMAHGVAHRVDRLTALGNGQVPRVAATAFTLLKR